METLEKIYTQVEGKNYEVISSAIVLKDNDVYKVVLINSGYATKSFFYGLRFYASRKNFNRLFKKGRSLEFLPKCIYPNGGEFATEDCFSDQPTFEYVDYNKMIIQLKNMGILRMYLRFDDSLGFQVISLRNSGSIFELSSPKQDYLKKLRERKLEKNKLKLVHENN